MSKARRLQLSGALAIVIACGLLVTGLDRLSRPLGPFSPHPVTTQ